MAEQILDYPVRNQAPSVFLSWRAVWAGFFVALLVSAILLSLGLAIGGTSLAHAVNSSGASGTFGMGIGLWFLVSALVALFVGSYYASRISAFIPTGYGAAQGGVIAALFFAIIIVELSFGVGMAARGAGAAANFLGLSVNDLAHNPEIQAAVAPAVDSQSLKSDPQAVVEGIAARMAAGDQVGARDFLAAQAGISKDEADVRIAEIGPAFDQAVRYVIVSAARSVSSVGWTLFLTLILGAAFAVFGGALGAWSMTHRGPSARKVVRPSMTPAFQS